MSRALLARLPVTILTAAVLLGLGALALPAQADDLPPTSEFFDEYDQNGDGRVTADEFRGSGEIFRLLDKNGDGRVSPDELGLPADYKPDVAARKRREAKEAAGKRGAAAPKGADRFRKALARMDADKDGRVSKAEWKGPENAFERFDRNKDGFLDAKDAPRGGDARGPQAGRKGRKGDRKGDRKPGERDGAALAEQLRARAKQHYASLDKDGNGKLTAEEAPNPRLIEAADADKDGSVSFEEFVALMKERAKAGGDRPGGDGRARGRGGRFNAGMLRRWDRDDDGKVSADEFPGRDEMFDRLDADKDGFLTAKDIAAAKQAAGAAKAGPGAKPQAPVTEKSGTLIEVQDRDGDGKLNRSEFRGSGEAWRRLDKNGDGWITPDELP